MDQRSRIFISYSHKDRAQADFLCASLRERGHLVLIDVEAVFDAEHITPRLQEMIRASDVVLLLLSPHWLASDPCLEELSYSQELNKRLLPVAFEDVGPLLPPQIKDIAYVRFYDAPGQQAALDRLEQAIDRDIEWVRAHTRYGELALRWAAGDGMEPRGRDLRAMQAWISRQPRGAPQPTAVHRAYLREGLKRANRAKIVTGAVSAVLVSAAVALFVVVERNAAARECEELRTMASQAESMNPVEAIQRMLTATGLTRCHTEDAWLDLIGELGSRLQGQRLRAEITRFEEPIEFVEFLPETGQLFTATGDHQLAVYDPATGAAASVTLTLPEAVPALRVVYDQGLMLLIQEHRVTVWDPTAGTTLGLPYNGTETVLEAALSPNRDTLVVATPDHNLHFHSLLSGRRLRAPMDLGADARLIAFARGSAQVVVAAGEGVRVLDFAPALFGDGEVQIYEVPGVGEASALAVSQDGSRFAVASGNSVSIWDTATRATILAPKSLYMDWVDITSLAFSPDGSQFAVGGSDKRARIHDSLSGKVLIDLIGHRSAIQSVRYAPDGQQVVTHDLAGVMRIFDVGGLQAGGGPTDPALAGLAENSTAGEAAAENRLEAPSGRITVTRSPDQGNILILHHAEDGAPPYYRDRLVHGGYITSLAFSADERLLVTGSEDGQVRVWDTHTGLLLAAFPHAPEGSVTFLAAEVGPEGNSVVSWVDIDNPRVWPIVPLQGDMFQTACRLLPFRDGVRYMGVMAAAEGVASLGDPCEEVALAVR